MGDMMTPTLQAAALGGFSNFLAQVLDSYRESKPFNLALTPLLHFIIFQLLSTPPNVLWQEFLEETFPGQYVDGKGNKRLRKLNTTLKLALDQTLGAVVNIFFFIAGIGALKGKDGEAIWEDFSMVSATPSLSVKYVVGTRVQICAGPRMGLSAGLPEVVAVDGGRLASMANGFTTLLHDGAGEA